MANMRRYNTLSLKRRRCYLSDEAYNQGGEASFSENYQKAMMANEKELVAEISKRCRAKLRLKGKLERGFEEVEVPDDKIPN
ncbi:hypothetical protein QL285_066095 [Trifolium repens]|nr:hypothetical protein QL285_066095 [Trifolium repens]